MIFNPAKREKIIPLIGIFGKSGSGKTLSALRLARGIVGPTGRIGGTDTENKRMTHFADDPVVGGFLHHDLQPPYSPEAYIKSFEQAIEEIDIWVVDSGSHEWTGQGGCLEIFEEWLSQKAGNDFAKRERLKMAAWAHVSPRHNAFVERLLRSKIPVILCFRAKDKVVLDSKEERPGARPKMEITKDEDAPISRKDLIFEMTVAFEMHEQEADGREKEGGYFSIRKKGPPSLYRILQGVTDKQLGVAHGRAIAEWCAGANAGRATATAAPTGKQPDPLGALKRELWEAARYVHLVPADVKDKGLLSAGQRVLEQWLIDESILSDTEQLATLAASRYPEVIEKIKAKRTPSNL